jgi:hypothetical protein
MLFTKGGLVMTLKDENNKINSKHKDPKATNDKTFTTGQIIAAGVLLLGAILILGIMVGAKNIFA